MGLQPKPMRPPYESDRLGRARVASKAEDVERGAANYTHFL